MRSSALEGEDQDGFRSWPHPAFGAVLVEAERRAQGFTHAAMIVEPCAHGFRVPHPAICRRTPHSQAITGRYGGVSQAGRREAAVVPAAGRAPGSTE